jgi:hypothetical protein
MRKSHARDSAQAENHLKNLTWPMPAPKSNRRNSRNQRNTAKKRGV